MPTKRSVSRRVPVSPANRRVSSVSAKKVSKPKSIYEKITKKKNPKWADKMFN